MGDYPVHPTSVHPGFLRRQLPADAPSRPELDTFGAALRDVRDLILPDLTHWQSPRQLAHFPASSSTVAALGEALTAGINVAPFTWAASPAATELEMVVVDWLGKALHLPETLMAAAAAARFSAPRARPSSAPSSQRRAPSSPTLARRRRRPPLTELEQLAFAGEICAVPSMNFKSLALEAPLPP